ncbi:MAG: leucine-rich repeat domain-containing protein, partial [Clostridiales bacterium]|nr:leucine-rich repeat domain-containing protein [Clostridiales bacterium]
FYDCGSLCKVVIPDSVTDVGEEVFAHCGNLSVLVLPKSLEHLAANLRVPKDFEIKNGVLIRYRGKLSIVKIPEGVTKIGERAFEGCSSMEQVNFPESVTVIGKNAFKDCRGLRNLSIPESIKRIEEDAFVNCLLLRHVRFPSTLEYIGDHAFGYYCYDKYDMPMPYKAYGKYPLFYVNYEEGSAADEYFKRHRK